MRQYRVVQNGLMVFKMELQENGERLFLRNINVQNGEFVFAPFIEWHKILATDGAVHLVSQSWKNGRGLKIMFLKC